MSFPQILKELRTEKGLTRTVVAKECNVSTQCISALEMGKRNPTGSTLSALADFFQCSTDYLLGREDDFGNVVIQGETNAPLSPDEQELLNIYQSLSPAHRSQVLEYARYFAEKSGATTRRKA